MKELSSLKCEVEHGNREPHLLVPCLARATHGADLRAVCGRFHRNLGVYIFVHILEEHLVYNARALAGGVFCLDAFRTRARVFLALCPTVQPPKQGKYLSLCAELSGTP